MRLVFCVLLAMIAFASKSLLCRAALRHTSIDPATFTSVRIISGALILALLLMARGRSPWRAGNWPSALAIFVYAAAFSFAYVDLSAGTGALLLFIAVQVTMIAAGLSQGEHLHPKQRLGLSVALGGLILLLSPGLTAPSPRGTILMLSAGIAWGVYSLRGRRNADPIATTSGNFVRAVPLAAVCSLIFFGRTQLDRTGLVYGAFSGAITSGLGYVIWYTALPSLKASTAATIQLSVPVLAALGGIVILHENFTLRFALASAAILGGIALVVVQGKR
jgi:drug/metabolite transporter (DMT)-like permease